MKKALIYIPVNKRNKGWIKVWEAIKRKPKLNINYEEDIKILEE